MKIGPVLTTNLNDKQIHYYELQKLQYVSGGPDAVFANQRIDLRFVSDLVNGIQYSIPSTNIAKPNTKIELNLTCSILVGNTLFSNERYRANTYVQAFGTVDLQSSIFPIRADGNPILKSFSQQDNCITINGKISALNMSILECYLMQNFSNYITTSVLSPNINDFSIEGLLNVTISVYGTN